MLSAPALAAATRGLASRASYRDADHKPGDRFGVEAIPHYFTIDSGGVPTAEMMGSGSNVEGKLKKLIKRTNAWPGETSDRIRRQEAGVWLG